MASPEQIQKLIDTGRTDEFVNEVAANKALSPRYGREFGAFMVRRAELFNARMIEQEMLEKVLPELRGPWLQWEDVLRQYDQLQGWHEYQDSKAVFGTSNNRADSSEIWKMAGFARALEMSGRNPGKMLYFIDPCSHTTEELLTEMGQDLGLRDEQSGQTDIDVFTRTFTIETREDIDIPQMEDPAWLPPYYLKPPTVEQIEALPLPEAMAHTRQLMLEAAQAAEGTHMGNWRIELDRRLIAGYLEKIGMPKDLLVVESFEEILGNSRDITVNEIADRAKHAWSTYRPKIIGGSDAAADRAPVVMRMVHKGKRIYIDADFKIFDEDMSEGRKYYDDPEMAQFSQEIQGMDVHTLMTTYPVNMGGVGYAILCARLAENAKEDNDGYDPDSPIATFMTDHYTLPNNMGIMSAEIMRGNGLDAVWITKGTRGRRVVDRNGQSKIDYWTPPDMLVDAERPASDMGRDRQMIEALGDIYVTNDCHSHVGSFYDALTGTEVGPVIMPVPTRAIDLLAEQEELPQNELGIILPALNRKEAWRLVNGLTGLTPERFNELVFGKNSDTEINIGTAREIQIALQGMDHLGNTLGMYQYMEAGSRQAITETLERLRQAALSGEELYEAHRNSLTRAEWVQYWDNKIRAYGVIAAEQGILLPAEFLDAPADDPEEMEKRASGSAKPFMEAVKAQRRNEMQSLRTPEVIALQGDLTGLDAIRDRYNGLRSLKFSLRPRPVKPGQTIDPEKQALRDQQLLENKRAFGFADTATEDDIQIEIYALAARLEQQANPLLDSILATVQIPVPEDGKKKKDDVSAEEQGQIIDRKGNISDQFTLRVQLARNTLSFLTKLAIVRSLGKDIPAEIIEAETVLDSLTSGTPSGVSISAETVAQVDEIYKDIEARIVEQSTEEYKRLASQVNSMWSEANMRTFGQERMANKKSIEDRVFREVTSVKNQLSPNLAALRKEVLSFYRTWRNSMIAAIAEQGFTLS